MKIKCSLQKERGMLKIWQDPQLRILLIMNFALVGIMTLFILFWLLRIIYRSYKKRKKIEQDSEKFRKFVERFKEKDFPTEIILAFEELNEGLNMLEQSTGERYNLLVTLITGIEEKFRLIESSNKIAEQSLAVTLQDILIKLKKQSLKLVDKHANNLFGKLKRLEEEEIARINDRLVILESFMEARQMLRSKSGELPAVGQEKNGESS